MTVWNSFSELKFYYIAEEQVPWFPMHFDWDLNDHLYLSKLP